MKKILVLILVIVLMLSIVPVTAMAAPATIEVNNMATFEEAFTNANDGDTIKLAAGTYTYDGDDDARFFDKFTGKNLTIEGAGTDKTFIVAKKYGLVLQNDTADPTNRKTVTVKNMTISSVHSWGHPIYAKNNIDVYLEDLVLTNPGGTAILMDSSNPIGGKFYNGTNTVVTATRVTIDSGDKVEFNANPCSSYPQANTISYAGFNFSDCTNISEDKCLPQGVSMGVGNQFLHNNTIVSVSDPIDATANISETATFTVEAKNTKSLQWQVDKNDGNGFTDIAGASAASYATDPVTAEYSGYKYRCVANGVYETGAATLTVTLPTDPADVSVNVGNTATFSVTPDNAASYQWQVDKLDGNGFADIAGASAASYTTDPAEIEWSGYKYRCIVNGSYETGAATLTVTVPAPPTTPSAPESDVPVTADSSMPLFFGIMLVLSALLIAGFVVRARKQSK